MENVNERPPLLDSIRAHAFRLGIQPRFLEDFVQEAWLLCHEYSEERKRDISALSYTEIHHRCLEARRRVIPGSREVLGVEAFEPSCESSEGESQSRDELRQLDFVLKNHPTLKLTPLQKVIWEQYAHDPKGRWKSEKAKEISCSRQNIVNITSLLRKKCESGLDLIRLWNGDVSQFFNKYNDGWATSSLRSLLWSVLRNRAGEEVAPEMRRHFVLLEDSMFQKVLEMLEKAQKKIEAGVGLKRKDISLIYNLLISSFQINPQGEKAKGCLEELLSIIPEDSWLLRRFVLRAGHLVDPHVRGNHKDWLKERIQKRDEAGFRFAKYAMAYYGGINSQETDNLLESEGKCPTSEISYSPIVSRLYDNMRIPRYSTSSVWMDINLLRIALMSLYFPFTSENLPQRSRNALIIICQKSLHSKDFFVVSSAENLLAVLLLREKEL